MSEKPKGKNIKGDLETKRQRALENLAKAREMKKAKLQSAHTEIYESESETDSGSESDSEFELVPVKGKSKGKSKPKQKDDVVSKKIEMLENTIKQLTKKKTKSKSKQQPIINNINIPAPEPKKEKTKSQDDLIMESIRRQILG